MARTILISDDDPALVSSLARLVKCGGFAAVTDTDSQVVALAEEHQPALIVLDVDQRIDGRTLLGALKMNLRTAAIPVVMLSGVGHRTVERFCLALGALDFVHKPVSPGFVRRLGELAGVPTEAELTELTEAMSKKPGGE